MTINVTEVPATAVNATFNVPENDTLYSTAAPGVLTGATNVDGKTLTAVLDSYTGPGTLVLNPNGSFTYKPAQGFIGTDSFTYFAFDGIQNSIPATVTLNVQDTPIVAQPHDHPSAAREHHSEPKRQPMNVLTGAYTGGNGTTFTAACGSGPPRLTNGGTVVLNSNGSFTYTPKTGYTGPDSFSYLVTDGTNISNTGKVSLTVNSIDIPVVVNQPSTASEDAAFTTSAGTAPGRCPTAGLLAKRHRSPDARLCPST